MNWDAAAAEGGILPTLLLPGVLGDGAPAAWDYWVRPFLRGPFPPAERTALLCAALERPGGAASPVHATGLSLLGQDGQTDLAEAWRHLADSAGGRAVLDATVALGAGQPIPAPRLAQAHAHLGARVAAWRHVVLFAQWGEALQRSLAHRVHPSADARLAPWLRRVVQAGPVPRSPG